MNAITKVMWTLFCLSVLAALSYYFQDKIEQQFNPNQQVKSEQQANRVMVTLAQNKQGHYVANGEINQQPVTFLLDTGATQIAIPAHLGKSLGLKAGKTQRVSTANGIVKVSATQIEQLRLGDITLYNLKGHLNPGMSGNTILLGMNALKQLELRQKNDTLTLIY